MKKDKYTEVIPEEHKPMKAKLSTYSERFNRVKRDFLELKWAVESHIDDHLTTRKKMEKIARIMFDIEQDFQTEKK